MKSVERIFSKEQLFCTRVGTLRKELENADHGIKMKQKPLKNIQNITLYKEFINIFL